MILFRRANVLGLFSKNPTTNLCSAATKPSHLGWSLTGGPTAYSVSSCKLGNKDLILSSLDHVMARGLVTVTFKSVHEILQCYHSNETSLMVLSKGTVWF